MKLLVNSIIVASFIAFASCNHEEKVMTKNEIISKADSIVGTRIEELNRQAMEDLDKRKSIEVKTKADSIVDAYIKTQPVPVTEPVSTAQ